MLAIMEEREEAIHVGSLLGGGDLIFKKNNYIDNYEEIEIRICCVEIQLKNEL